ncbi:hypothetical protein [Pseudomonas vranovensis]|uniref:hypothetical protein n=1 Tax=Pseudomonas vranovensis TaxID=321661 RepID=UPI003D951944
MDMADPYVGMLSFQKAMEAGELDISLVTNHQDLYSHIDRPEPGTTRLTYVRLSENQKVVQAFVACIINGQVNGHPCVAVGYAVPENLRSRGNAKKVLRDVIGDQIYQAGCMGFSELYVEAVVDVTNIESQRVAEAVLSGSRESITDRASGCPAFRYTSRFDTSTGEELPI